MDLKLFKLQLILHHFSSKKLVFKLLIMAIAMAAMLCFALIREIDPINGCDPPWAKFRLHGLKIFEDFHNSTLELDYNARSSRKGPNFDPVPVFQDLMASGWVTRGNRVLCVGHGAAKAVMALRKLGFRGAIGVDSKACPSLVVKGSPYELPFAASSFDFVHSRALDAVRVPARLVMEMERVLRPGKAGSVGRCVARPLQSSELMKAAAPVSSFLRYSDVVDVRTVNCSVMVIFRKREVAAAAAIDLPVLARLPAAAESEGKVNEIYPNAPHRVVA